ncbi:hypothetical protein K1719_033392 [Acacia pycnantha]|nr:hypothetical protein K1719_033392 [Acacia pycnantha]
MAKCKKKNTPKKLSYISTLKTTLFLFSLLGILMFVPFSPYPCAITLPNVSISSGYRLKSELGVISSNGYASKSELEGFSSENGREEAEEEETGESEFWKQPDGLGYRPCLGFSKEFRIESEKIVKEKRKYLMVVVAGGLNQQRNQIVDAVVVARILGAALVVPILKVNVIWGDER